MDKLLKGMGYLTWAVCNIAGLYGLGRGAYILITTNTLSGFIFYLALGIIMLFACILLSILCLGLIALLFNDTKVINKVTKWLPFIDI